MSDFMIGTIIMVIYFIAGSALLALCALVVNNYYSDQVNPSTTNQAQTLTAINRPGTRQTRQTNRSNRARKAA